MERLFAFLDTAAGSGILLCHENEKGIYGDTAHQQRHKVEIFYFVAGRVEYLSMSLRGRHPLTGTR